MSAADLARFASLLADGTRAEFCMALLDGRAWTAGELAAHAGVAPSTATEHLNRLVDGGLLTERRQGRHRYVQISDPDIAELLETLSSHFAPIPEPQRTLRGVNATAALARGRTCYDHLAGLLGVSVTDAMTGLGLLDQSSGFALTDDGLAWLTGPLGADPALFHGGKRPLARACLDWTERRTHLAGAAGAAVCARFRQQGWIRSVGAGRAVQLTPTGETAVLDLLGLTLA
jgi:DNA-binding transcriptional ArsR family regulator